MGWAAPLFQLLLMYEDQSAQEVYCGLEVGNSGGTTVQEMAIMPLEAACLSGLYSCKESQETPWTMSGVVMHAGVPAPQRQSYTVSPGTA